MSKALERQSLCESVSFIRGFQSLQGLREDVIVIDHGTAIRVWDYWSIIALTP
jgi:hypothetical protein